MKNLIVVFLLLLFFSSCTPIEEVNWQKINELIKNDELKELKIVDRKYTIVELKTGKKLKARLEEAPIDFLKDIHDKRSRGFNLIVFKPHYNIYGTVEYYFFQISILGIIVVITGLSGWFIIKMNKK